MKVLNLLVFIGAAWAQNAPTPAPAAANAMPNLPDEAVVAKFDDGTTFTMGEFKKFYNVLNPQQQQMALSDRTKFLHQWALFRKLNKEAEDMKLADQSPYKETIEYQRMQVLFGARVNEELNSTIVQPADILKWYETNKEKYKQVKVKAIYITFSDAPASSSKVKKILTEEEAKAKGAMFVDTFKPSEGHNACEPVGTRWVEPLNGSLGAAVHPNATGEEHDALDLEAAMAKVGLP